MNYSFGLVTRVGVTRAPPLQALSCSVLPPLADHDLGNEDADDDQAFAHGHGLMATVDRVIIRGSGQDGIAAGQT